MNRTPYRESVLMREPLKSILVALSLVSFFAVGGLFGATALGVFFALWCVSLLYAGFRFARKLLREAEEDRARSVKAHAAVMADRMMAAQRQGFAYEASSAELAEGFGRIPQDVPDRLIEEERVIARHAAGLVAEGVLRMEVDGFPVTVFDLEVINYDDVADLKRRGSYSRAAEAAKDYLTVCVVTLPVPLPYLASAWLFDREAAHTADADFAEVVMSVPLVRQAVLDVEPPWPWSVQQDRLISCELSGAGLDVPAALALATRLTQVAGAFPWTDLERFRLSAPEPRPQYTLWASLGQYTPVIHNPWVRRWDAQEIGRSGLRAYRSHSEVLKIEAVSVHPST
ncbi:hypothetical protein [Streptomyces justiciae]|uniref:hypothetical protein n=1 Tax=Streptomyces justiciae TaxID=2780140 RepID=UPI00187EF900|nr:hypothetical protein [Streptomyces justiciae]MBE8476793.1 hypothetical protein [Streptomyces justiciae]